MPNCVDCGWHSLHKLTGLKVRIKPKTSFYHPAAGLFLKNTDIDHLRPPLPFQCSFLFPHSCYSTSVSSHLVLWQLDERKDPAGCHHVTQMWPRLFACFVSLNTCFHKLMRIYQKDLVIVCSSVWQGQKLQCHNRSMLDTLAWAQLWIHETVMAHCCLDRFYWTVKVWANKSGLILYGQRMTRDLTHTTVSMSHISSPRLLTSGAACCIIKRGRRVTYIKETGTTDPSIIWESERVRGEGRLNARHCRVQSIHLTLHFCVMNKQGES